MSSKGNSLAKSTWTPLSNENSNNKIFEERRVLVGKWFDKWTSQQRKVVLEDLLEKSKLRQLEFVGAIVKEKVPTYHDDFTKILPRVISLYIFSHLDPRSLCRCSKVSWYWHYLTDLDEIWMPKCLRLGWYIGFSPSPFERGIWKRHYIENLKSLRYLKPKEPDVESVSARLNDVSVNGSPRYDDSPLPPSNKPPSASKKRGTYGVDKPPPWRGSDPVPKDTWRYNYLQNQDEVDKVAKLRKKGAYGSEAIEVSQRAQSKVKTGKNKLNTLRVRSRSLPREGSPSELPDDVSVVSQRTHGDGRPEWAQTRQGAPFVNSRPSAATRPAPVRPPTIVKNTRTERDLPSSELFPENPWTVPKTEEEEYDSDY